MLTVVFAHRHEALRDRLLASLETANLDPLGQHEIIVPSVAIARELRLAASQRFGIAANLRFSYLAAWLWEQMSRFTPVPDTSPYAPARLTWRILQSIASLDKAPHPRLARFCEHAEPLARYQLAQRLASLFDQYLTYRPQWIDNWSQAQGELIPEHPDAAWQAAIWKHLLSSDTQPAPLLPSNFFRSAPALPPGKQTLPGQVHVFALPSIPPVYLHALRHLSHRMAVTVYARNPSREYWLDTCSVKSLARLASRGLDPHRAHRETGNRLLAAWGTQTRDHLGLLLEHADEETRFDDEAFSHDTFPETALGQLQAAIFRLEDIAPGALVLQEDDRSIELHVCHSLTRQLEVLHDQLLSRFATAGADRPLHPADVLVALPDLDAAIPFIHAVFGSAPGNRYIPYAITGGSARQVNPIARALTELLETARSRWQAEAVLGLLRHPAIARRFHFTEEDLGTLTHWVDQAGIRWGRDAQHQREQCPESELADGLPRHSFDYGLERLLLGFALPVDNMLFAGTLPSPGPEGSQTRLLGGFCAFIEALGALQASLRHARTPAGWQRCLADALENFMQAEQADQEALTSTRQAIRDLTGNMAAGGAQADIAAEIMLHALGEALDQTARGGVPGGQVTFTALPSLRGLPYRHICLLGLDGQVFPATRRAPEFDLMAAQPSYGDRQRRDDERNLFLDYLLNAREGLYLSYTGRDQRDNSPLPASILIDELFDYLTAGAGKMLPAWRVEHPLQAFSPRYFSQTTPVGIFSYAEEIRQALADRASTPVPPEAFFSTPLGERAPQAMLSGKQLHEFLTHPARYLIRHQLGLTLPRPEEAMQEEEPFGLGYRERDALNRRLLPALLRADQTALPPIIDAAAAAPEAPWGSFGRALIEQEIETLTPFSAKIRAITEQEQRLPARLFNLPVALGDKTVSLYGQLDACFSDGLLRFHSAPRRVSDLIAAWIDHLILCQLATQDKRLPTRTRLLCLDGNTTFSTVDNPAPLLATLLAAYEYGQRQPLPFFPKSAWAAAQGQDPLPIWVGSQMSRGEREDAYTRLAWRDAPDPLGTDFRYWCEAIFAPLCAHLQPPVKTDA